MKWTVEELKRLRTDRLILDDVVNVRDLMEQDKQIRDISPVKVQGEASLTNHVISFHLHLTGRMVLPCSLTLEDVDYPFTIDTIESFLLDQHAKEWEENENEVVHEVDGNTVDLMPIIKENILLSIPMKVVHPDAKIKTSGKGWEILSGNEKKREFDPRMAKLAELFEKKNNI